MPSCPLQSTSYSDAFFGNCGYTAIIKQLYQCQTYTAGGRYSCEPHGEVRRSRPLQPCIHLIPYSVNILFRTNSGFVWLRIMAFIRPMRPAYSMNCRLFRTILKQRNFWTGSPRVPLHILALVHSNLDWSADSRTLYHPSIRLSSEKCLPSPEKRPLMTLCRRSFAKKP